MKLRGGERVLLRFRRLVECVLECVLVEDVRLVLALYEPSFFGFFGPRVEHAAPRCRRLDSGRASIFLLRPVRPVGEKMFGRSLRPPRPVRRSPGISHAGCTVRLLEEMLLRPGPVTRARARAPQFSAREPKRDRDEVSLLRGRIRGYVREFRASLRCSVVKSSELDAAHRREVHGLFLVERAFGGGRGGHRRAR